MSPLSPHHRRSLFTSLSPIVGEEEADALLDQLPRTEEEVPATAADLRTLDLSLRSEMATGFAELRTEMHDGQARQTRALAELRSEMHTGFSEIRSEMHTGFSEIRNEMHTSVTAIVRKIADLETSTGAALVKHMQWTVWAVFGAISIGMALAALIARTQV